MQIIEIQSGCRPEDNDAAARFGELKARLGSSIRIISEVYTKPSPRVLAYRPISEMSASEVFEGRSRLESGGRLKLSGVEVVLEETVGVDPESRRRKGCFRRTMWFTRDFRQTSMPPEIAERKALLDKESGWLRGGPK